MVQAHPRIFLGLLTALAAALPAKAAENGVPAPGSRPTTAAADLMASVNVMLPRPGFAGSPASMIESTPVFRIPQRAGDFMQYSIDYRLSVSETGRVHIAAWVNGMPSRIATLRSDGSVSAADPDLASDERGKDAAITLRMGDASGQPLISFDLGHLLLRVSGGQLQEGTTVADAPFGRKRIRTWKRSPAGWDYQVSEAQLWQRSPAQAAPPAGVHYINGGGLCTAGAVDAKPFRDLWTERQIWAADGHWWVEIERRMGGPSGPVAARMRTEKARPATASDAGRGSSTRTSRSP